MLFVSRYKNLDNVCVVDTDDGIEEEIAIAELDDLEDLVEIAGVNPDLGTVYPYQLRSQVTTLQTKLAMLSFVEVVTWNDMVTNIRWREDKITTPVTVRLSDFGTRVADFVLRGDISRGKHVITLVFDDKLKGCEWFAFSPLTADSVGVDGLGVVFDFREVVSERLVAQFYRSLMLRYGRGKQAVVAKILDSIEDEAMRKIRMYHELTQAIRGM